MAITDKTRKILWGRSGNLCAICRQRLVVDETNADSESVVGDECHIISGSAKGPRHDPGFDSAAIDNLENLILLCRVHHKMIDDQCETYQADLLRTIKVNHEKWIENKLNDDDEEEEEEIQRVRFHDQIPQKLALIESGYDLFNLAMNCHGTYFDHSQDLSNEEVELIGGFHQNLQDWMDIADQIEPLGIMRAKKSVHAELQNLREKGFLVFAANEKQLIKGGIGKPAEWRVLHLSLVRKDDPNIRRSDG